MFAVRLQVIHSVEPLWALGASVNGVGVVDCLMPLLVGLQLEARWTVVAGEGSVPIVHRPMNCIWKTLERLKKSNKDST